MTLAEAMALAGRAGRDSIDGERPVTAWVGDRPDQSIPPRVADRVLRRFRFCCWNCGRDVRGGKPWTLEHLVALINGGFNAETNLGVTCDLCTPIKNRQDVSQKAETYRKRAKYMGLVKRKHPSRWPPRGSRPLGR